MAWQKSYPEEMEEKISKINAAQIINSTLENLWRDAYKAMSSENFVLWNRKLDAIWLILGGDVKKDGQEEKTFHDLELKIYEKGSLKSKKPGFSTMNIEKLFFQNLHYSL
jgi:hypothetical protein